VSKNPFEVDLTPNPGPNANSHPPFPKRNPFIIVIEGMN
jgi:hypothetical protein